MSATTVIAASASIALALALTGCERRSLAPPSGAGAPSSATSAAPAPSSAAAASPDDQKAFDERAKAVIDGALEITKRCRLISEELGDWFDQDIYDDCAWKEGDVAGFTKRASDLRAFVEERGRGLSPERATFAAHARMFGDWIALSARTGATRGTLELYQGLAIAYNALAPLAPAPVDPPSALAQYFEKMDVPHDDYLASSYGWYAERKKRGTPLAWLRGMNGPRLHH